MPKTFVHTQSLVSQSSYKITTDLQLPFPYKLITWILNVPLQYQAAVHVHSKLNTIRYHWYPLQLQVRCGYVTEYFEHTFNYFVLGQADSALTYHVYNSQDQHWQVSLQSNHQIVNDSTLLSRQTRSRLVTVFRGGHYEESMVALQWPWRLWWKSKHVGARPATTRKLSTHVHVNSALFDWGSTTVPFWETVCGVLASTPVPPTWTALPPETISSLWYKNRKLTGNDVARDWGIQGHAPLDCVDIVRMQTVVTRSRLSVVINSSRYL